MEFDVEVKFIHRFNGANSAGSFMSFFRFDICPPEWIDGDAVFEKASDPGEVVLFALLHAWVNCIVHEQNASFFLFDQLVHLFPSATDHFRTIRIDHDGIRIIKNGFILGPSRVYRCL